MRARGLVVAVLLLSGAGCNVDPYCLSCADAEVDPDGGMDGAVGDAQVRDAQVSDASDGAIDGCLEDELCNDVDDDCDGFVDEDFDLSTNPQHCGECDARCAPVHAFGVCDDGDCTLGECDVGWYDLDGDPANGCEYRCVGTETSEVRCDLADDDCDGLVDEDFDLLTDEMNCGRCGRTCSLLNATGQCAGACDGDPANPCTSDADCAAGESCEGTCTLSMCDPDYWNLDMRAANGCEYNCTQATPPLESCNASDDDCDGTVDETVAELGGTPCTSDADCPGAQTCDTSAGTCDPGVCGTSDVGECQLGTWDSCTGSRLVCSGNIEPTTEVCDGLDNDCDGTDDNSPSDVGRVCSTGAGVCSVGSEICDTGALACDCPGGFTRIMHPSRGALCVPNDGPGGVIPGYLAMVWDGMDLSELCNGFDDDCDGTVDEASTDVGVVCADSVSTGSPAVCTAGITACVSGAPQCTCPAGFSLTSVSGTDYCLPTGDSLTETCDAEDDDCDGTTDESPVGVGGFCGPAAGICENGTTVCSSGSIDCSCPMGTTTINHPTRGTLCIPTNGPGGAVPGYVSMIWDGSTLGELCNNIDDDCDGTVDEMPSGTGGACANAVATGSPSACVAGTISCVGGSLSCSCPVGFTFTQTGGMDYCRPDGAALLEVCDPVDNDCDSTVDEGFDTTTDVNNCGGCGIVCSLANVAVQSCVGSTCVVGPGNCATGFYDLDGNPMNGCEYACGGDPSFSEVCNARDDDCDGMVDEAVPLPLGCNGDPGRPCATVSDCAMGETCEDAICNNNGVCAATAATCSTTVDEGWVCNYPSTHEDVETLCDGLDNDCDGQIDEPYLPSAGGVLGTSCFNGMGECRRDGTWVCNATFDGVVCNAAAAGTPADEECDGLDNDCDGMADEREVDDPGTAWRDGVDVNAIDTVTVDLGGGVLVEMMSYEASRPDATSSTTGTMSHVACSRANVMPWVNVSWQEAQDACCALNPSGSCPAPGGSGWRLCDAPDWQTGCEGPGGSCTWSYSAMCSMSQQTVCNGAEHDCDPSTPGDQDCRYNTGSPTFPMCYSDWGVDGRAYDMSGNVREWTATDRGMGFYEVRGGSYNHIEAGRSCQWDFTIADSTTRAPNTGFRCCLY